MILKKLVNKYYVQMMVMLVLIIKLLICLLELLKEMFNQQIEFILIVEEVLFAE